MIPLRREVDQPYAFPLSHVSLIVVMGSMIACAIVVALRATQEDEISSMGERPTRRTGSDAIGADMPSMINGTLPSVGYSGGAISNSGGTLSSVTLSSITTGVDHTAVGYNAFIGDGAATWHCAPLSGGASASDRASTTVCWLSQPFK